MSLANAQAATPNGTWFDRWSRELVVQADGSFVETIDDALVVEGEAAAGGAVQRALHWNASTGTIEIVEAATLKTDGRRIPAPTEMVIEATESVRDGVFQDRRYRIVTYLDVDPGDQVLLKAVHRRTIPYFAHHFFDDRGPPERPAREARIVYDVPDSMELRFDAVGYRSESVEHANGRRRHTWRHAGGHPVVAEHRVVAASDYADRLTVSTMRDYRALARAYTAGAYERADPTAAIGALALELTRGATTDRARARALYDWTRGNVRYGGTQIGAAAVVPKYAQATLDDREGDCKDQATLFEALLASVGISSSAVMVNATEAYRLPAVPTLGVFDHVLTWIPALGIFADATASSTRFGELPAAVADKPALIVKTGELMRTPVQRPLAHSVRLEGEIDALGRARFTLEDTPRGWFAANRRSFFEFADRDELHAAAEGMLYLSRLVGNASVRGRVGRTPDDPVRLLMTADVAGLVTDDDPPRIRALSGIGVGIGQALDDFHPLRAHVAPSVCVSKHVDEHASWLLAPGLLPIELPGALSIRGHGFSYASRYRLEGRRLEIRRSLRVDFDGNVCTPERFRIVRRLAGDVLADLEGAAIVRRAASR